MSRKRRQHNAQFKRKVALEAALEQRANGKTDLSAQNAQAPDVQTCSPGPAALTPALHSGVAQRLYMSQFFGVQIMGVHNNKNLLGPPRGVTKPFADIPRADYDNT